METLLNYQRFIESAFNFLGEEYHMKFSLESEYTFSWENELCIFRLGIDRYYPDVSMAFISKKNGQNVFLMKVHKVKKLLGKKIYPDEIYASAEIILNPIEKDLYFKSHFVKIYCSDLLNGEFGLYEKQD